MLKANLSDKNFNSIFESFLKLRRRAISDVSAEVIPIIDEVRKNGDDALIKFAMAYDHCELTATQLRVSEGEIQEAFDECSKRELDALQIAADRIIDFHRRQFPEDLSYLDLDGVRLGWRWTPIREAGIYVPGGTASYPSSVLMNALPARIAGVERLVMVTPTSNYKISPLVLVAAKIAKVDEIYRIGGAQAIAALVYGTESIKSVDKVVGPGNIYVAAAKRLLFGEVGIDMVAGPSEIMVVADDTSNSDWIAADLLSQAEHDKNAQAMLVTNSHNFAESVLFRIEELIEKLPRRDIASQSWKNFGAIFVVEEIEQSFRLVNAIAPEHLQLSVSEPEKLLGGFHNAGAIFLGHYTPEALGDYVAGPSHVLPTNGSAKYFSGLGTIDFMKRSSLISASLDSIEKIGPAAITLAEAEGLEAHALSVSMRLPGK